MTRLAIRGRPSFSGAQTKKLRDLLNSSLPRGQALRTRERSRQRRHVGTMPFSLPIVVRDEIYIVWIIIIIIISLLLFGDDDDNDMLAPRRVSSHSSVTRFQCGSSSLVPATNVPGSGRTLSWTVKSSLAISVELTKMTTWNCELWFARYSTSFRLAG